MFRVFLIAIALVLFSACNANSQPLAVCIAAAKDQLELFSIGEKTLESRCKCVRSRRNGQLPGSLAEWGVTGRGSPILNLIECSEADIYGFYQKAVFNSAKSRMEKSGKRVDGIEAFSACVAAGAFQQMRRVAASEDGTPRQLDKAEFRRMYGQCEVEIN